MTIYNLERNIMESEITQLIQDEKKNKKIMALNLSMGAIGVYLWWTIYRMLPGLSSWLTYTLLPLLGRTPVYRLRHRRYSPGSDLFFSDCSSHGQWNRPGSPLRPSRLEGGGHLYRGDGLGYSFCRLFIQYDDLKFQRLKKERISWTTIK